MSAASPGSAVIVSLPPRPLTVSRSLVRSMKNSPRFTRSKRTRLPWGLIVNWSPAVGAPLTTVSSLPASPSTTSLPSPLFQTRTSLPSPPSMSSLPLAPAITSLPAPPRRLSASLLPVRASLPPWPSTVADRRFAVLIVTASSPSPALTTRSIVLLAGSVWSPAVTLSKSVGELKPLPIWLWFSSPAASPMVRVSAAASPLSVTVVPTIAELYAALADAGSARAAAAAVAAISAPRRVFLVPRAIFGPPEIVGGTTRETPTGRTYSQPGMGMRDACPA